MPKMAHPLRESSRQAQLAAGAGESSSASDEGSIRMLWALIAILLILWLLGFTVANLGAFVHLLLVVALIVLIVQLLSGRRAV
jgi:hypothetical protein